MKTSAKIQALVAGGMLALVLIGLAGIWGARQGSASLATVHDDRMVPAVQLAQIDRLMHLNRLLLLRAHADPRPETIEMVKSTVASNTSQIDKTWEAYMATYLTAEESALAKQWAQQYARFSTEALNPALQAIASGDQERLKSIALGASPTLHQAATQTLDALMEIQASVALAEVERAKARERSIFIATITVTLLCLLACAGYGLWLARHLSRALGAEPDELCDIVDSVSKGDLSRTIAVQAGDSHSVMFGLKAMQTTLARSVGTVRLNADSVAVAAAQIASGNQDLSGRTELQASALQETASSMEELGSTVKQNADNAKQANELALSASSVAVKGGEVVSQVVETMKGINDSSKRIADIISVIDGIAFQTNILALNAAVEAARAGEQGRGFAVVASEVRSLAQRSAEAAKEIKTLITASVERVAQGTELVDQAGKTMDEVVTSIRRVTQIVGEISVASAEQSSGVSQVAQSIEQMDTTTQQNAALVEESAAAADSLKQQAQQLVAAVSSFRFAQGLSATPAPAPTPQRAAPRPEATKAPPVATTGAVNDDWTSF